LHCFIILRFLRLPFPYTSCSAFEAIASKLDWHGKKLAATPLCHNFAFYIRNKKKLIQLGGLSLMLQRLLNLKLVPHSATAAANNIIIKTCKCAMRVIYFNFAAYHKTLIISSRPIKMH